MRVLFVYYTHKPGGFCVRLYRLMSALVQRGHQVTYLCLDKPPSQLDERVSWDRIPFPISKRSGLLFWGVFTAWLPLWLVVRCAATRPERLVAFGAYYAAAATVACRIVRVPLVLFLRSLTFEIDRITGKPTWLRHITGCVDRFGIRAADLVVCMTGHMQERVENFVGKKLTRCAILPNDLPVRSPHPQRVGTLLSPGEGRGITVLTAGVLDPRKNVSVLVEALAILDQRGIRDVKLLIAGEGTERRTLESLVARHKLTNVTLAGWCSDLAPLFKVATVLAHPALHEGIANTVLEALSHGVPVIVSDIPEHRELFPAEVSVVPVADASAWASALEKLKDPSFVRALMAASDKVARQLSFDWDAAGADLVCRVSESGKVHA